ncbi:MAG: alpha/beta hydrolase [Bacteroidota bacterium]
MEKSKHIVLIHGNFVNNHAWAEWKTYYEAQGYIVHTPSNPGHEGVPADLRQNIHPDLAATGIIEVVDNLSRFIDTLPEKPLIIGHSMGGLAVMKLIEMGKAVAGVSVHGVPPKNIMAPPQTVKTVWPAFGFFSFKKTWLGSRKWFNKAFFNTLPERDRAAAYDAFAVPESFKINTSILFNGFGKVDFSQPHEPLLFLGGGSDHIFPASLAEKIAGSYTHPHSRVDVNIFPGRSHFTCGEPGWEKVADYILDWYEGLPY